MTDKKEDGYCAKIADAALLRLISRLTVPLIGALCALIFNSTIDMGKTIVSLTEKLDGKVATLEAKIDGVEKRTGNLEDWRNNLDAFANEQPSRRGTGL